ncbi:MAG: DUF2252 family protein [Polyangiales bacterium]
MSKKELPLGVPSPKNRATCLAELKSRKMASDPHAFVRARADLFYEAMVKVRGVPKGPAIWIGGDCHSENVGAVATAHGTASLDLNDLDETVVGYPAHDVLRLALDVAIAARSQGVRGADTLATIAGALDGYCLALHRRSPSTPVALDEAPPRLRKLLRDTGHETRSALLDHRVPRDSKGIRRFDYGPRYFPLSLEEKKAASQLVARPEVRTLIASMTDEAPDTPIEIVDSAFRVAGTGSLGGFRVAVLVHVGKRKRELDDEKLRLIDLKQARPSHATRRGKVTPPDDAERVVRGARALVPALGERMLAASLLGKRVVVRELMPQEHKVSLEGLDPGEGREIARYLGEVLGRAHGRQLDAEAAEEWAREVGKKRTRPVPPKWLFEALLSLVSIHEVEYLRHCAAAPLREADQKER